MEYHNVDPTLLPGRGLHPGIHRYNLQKMWRSERADPSHCGARDLGCFLCADGLVRTADFEEDDEEGEEWAWVGAAGCVHKRGIHKIEEKTDSNGVIRIRDQPGAEILHLDGNHLPMGHPLQLRPNRQRVHPHLRHSVRAAGAHLLRGQPAAAARGHSHSNVRGPPAEDAEYQGVYPLRGAY